MNNDLEQLRNKPIAGYSHPSTVNKGKRGGVYSTYNTKGDEPYKSGSFTEKYNNQKTYGEKNCFLCENAIDKCTCNVKSSKK